ncbi:hypothetical protein EHJ72_004396 [Escherichia coli]|nr:hypothetical protein [Escherichia coli]
MKMFKGLTNEPEAAFHHIAVLLEAGLIISASSDEECDELSDDIFLLAQQYARSACDAFKELDWPPEPPDNQYHLNK